MERFPISITLLANAGVRIGYRGMTLLLDGVFGREGNPFSPMPAGCWQKMCRGEPPFEQLDCLLFTHFHPDHFSPEMTMELVEDRPVKALFFPEDERTAGTGIKALLGTQENPLRLSVHM